jgi:ribosome modulation factor
MSTKINISKLSFSDMYKIFCYGAQGFEYETVRKNPYPIGKRHKVYDLGYSWALKNHFKYGLSVILPWTKKEGKSMTEQQEQHIREQGYKAFCAGQTLEDCYLKGSPGQVWREGWKDAERKFNHFVLQES